MKIDPLICTVLLSGCVAVGATSWLVYENSQSKALLSAVLVFVAAFIGIISTIVFDLQEKEDNLNLISTFTYDKSNNFFSQLVYTTESRDRIFFEQPVGKHIVDNKIIDKFGIDKVAVELMAANTLQFIYSSSNWFIKKEVFQFGIDEVRNTITDPKCEKLTKNLLNGIYSKSNGILGKISFWGGDYICIPNGTELEFSNHLLILKNKYYTIRFESGPVLMNDNFGNGITNITVRAVLTTQVNRFYSSNRDSEKYSVWLKCIREEAENWFKPAMARKNK